MPFQPGTPATQMPAGDDALIRRVQELERAVRELGPSVAASVRTIVAALVKPDTFGETATGFDPITGAWGTVATATLTVPEGFTAAVVTATCYARIINTTASTYTQIHTRVLIDAQPGPSDDEWSDAGRSDTAGNTYSDTLTGLTPGATFGVSCQAYAGADFTADADNKAVISGTVLWVR